MSDRFGSLWHPIARLVFVETLIPVGVAAAAGLAVAAIVPPHWRAAGLPWFLGYGKNVEVAAIAAALAAGVATQLLVATRRGLGCCALVAALGYAIVAIRYPVPPLLSGWPRLAALAAIAALAGRAAVAAAGDVVPAAPPAPTLAATALAPMLAVGLVGAAALAVFAFAVGPPPLSVDVFHHGEVLDTAVDLLRGGRPFETLIWPHGFHDSGLAALWLRATGKVGTSPVALAWASCCALGVVSAYVLGRRMLGSRVAAIAACLAAALAPLLIDEAATDASGRALEQLGVLIFVALACAAVTARRRRYFAAGLCCGLAHLFRIETGVYAALAALAVMACRELAGAARTAAGSERATGGEPAAAGSARAAGREPTAASWERATVSERAISSAAGGAGSHPGRGAAWALGVGVLRFAGGLGLVLAGCRLLFGWPAAAWFAYTLGELPRFHRDAMGTPLPWPRRGVPMSLVESVTLQIALSRLLFTLLLLVQALRALLAQRRARSPAAESPQAGALLFVALFGALATKSALDRSDLGHVLQWTALPLLAAACLAVAAWGGRRSWGPGRTALAAFVTVLLLDFGWLGLRLPALRSAGTAAGAAGERWQGLLEHLRPNPPAGACADRSFTPAESRIDANRRFIAETCAVEALLRERGVRRMVVADGAPWYDVRFDLAPASRYISLARAYTPTQQLGLIAAWRGRPTEALLLVRGHGAIGVYDVPDAIRVPVADAYLRARRGGVAATPTALGDLFFWDEPPPRAAAAGAASGLPETDAKASERPDTDGRASGQPDTDGEASPARALHRQRPLSGVEWQDLGAAIERAAALGRADRAAAVERAGRAAVERAGHAATVDRADRAAAAAAARPAGRRSAGNP